MSGASAPQPSSSCDCLFTGIAVTVLLAQGSWSWAKRSAHEGWLTCQSGAHEAYRVTHHLYEATSHLFECIATIVTHACAELGDLFGNLKTETVRTFGALGSSLQSTRECLGAILAPLSEVGAVCVEGAHSTMRAARALWQGCGSAANLLHGVVAPLGQEICHTMVSGADERERLGEALYLAGRTSADIAKAALEGTMHELIDLFTTALKTTGQTAHAAEHSVKTWLTLSKDSSYRLILEAASTCTVGYEECLKTAASLPPAVQAFLLMPIEGAASLLRECGDTLMNGSNQTIATLRGVYHAATVGIDLLKVTLLSSLSESAHMGKTGLNMSQKSLVAAVQAIDHGTEQMRSVLLSMLFESFVTLSAGVRSVPRAAYAIQEGVTHGAEMVGAFCIPLLQENATVLVAGGESTMKAVVGSCQSIDAATSQLRDLAFRSGVEAVYCVGVLSNQTCMFTHDFKNDVLLTTYIASDWPIRSVRETHALACSGLQEARHFDYQMTHEVERSLDVYVVHPIIEGIYPKIEAIRASFRSMEARISAILSSWGL